MVDVLQPGDKFETLHTNLIGKVVECLPEEGGVKVVLYIPGKGWLARTLHHSCIVKQRE